MDDLSKVVDSLENRISGVLQKQQDLVQIKAQLEAEIEDLKTQKLQFEKEMEEWKEKSHSLKLANSLLGSDQYKRETKLKINALIREIDQCIVQLTP